jgi:hypothetical protein
LTSIQSLLLLLLKHLPPKNPRHIHRGKSWAIQQALLAVSLVVGHEADREAGHMGEQELVLTSATTGWTSLHTVEGVEEVDREVRAVEQAVERDILAWRA